MAIYRAGNITGAISGALGGAVFVAAKGSPVVRHRPSRGARHRDQSTTEFGNPKTILAGLTRAWRELTDVQRQAWNTAAANRPRPNRLGQHRSLSGYQYWLREGFFRTLVGGAYVIEPPLDGIAGNPSAVTLAFKAGGPFNFTPTAAAINPVSQYLVYGRIVYTTSLPQYSAPLKLFGTPLVLFPPLDLYSIWILTLPDPPVGARIMFGVRAVNVVNETASLQVYTTVVVP